MSIFPFIDGANEVAPQQDTTTSIPREYAWDFENNDFILQNGKFVIVEGLEAIRVWVYKALKTRRYTYPAYSWDFGHELENLISSGSVSRSALQSEVKRYIEEALLVNKNINRVSNVSISINDNILGADFTINTSYGEVAIHV